MALLTGSHSRDEWLSELKERAGSIAGLNGTTVQAAITTATRQLIAYIARIGESLS